MGTASGDLGKPFSSSFMAIKMDATHQLARAARAGWAEEIERAVRNAKRTPGGQEVQEGVVEGGLAEAKVARTGMGF